MSRIDRFLTRIGPRHAYALQITVVNTSALLFLFGLRAIYGWLNVHFGGF